MSRRHYVRTTTAVAAPFSDALQADGNRFDGSRFNEVVLGDSDHFAVRDSVQMSA